MTQPNTRAALAALFAATLVGACGGGGGGGAPAPAPAPTTDVPASAQASVDGLVAYVTQLLGMNSDTAEPILVGDAVLPTSDTTEAAR